MTFSPTIILRHRRENLKKCSLRGLETRGDIHFYTYPRDLLPSLKECVMLDFDAPLLSKEDANHGLFLIDATWRYAEVMARQVKEPVIRRSLPPHYRTVYPRRQDDCADPSRGLATVEALYIAYRITGRDASGLLDHYHWRDAFLSQFADELHDELKNNKAHQDQQHAPATRQPPVDAAEIPLMPSLTITFQRVIHLPNLYFLKKSLLTSNPDTLLLNMLNRRNSTKGCCCYNPCST